MSACAGRPSYGPHEHSPLLSDWALELSDWALELSDRALEPIMSRSRGRPVTGARHMTCAQRIARAAVVRSSHASFSPLTVLTLEPTLQLEI
jgi:hypothetical protein